MLFEYFLVVLSLAALALVIGLIVAIDKAARVVKDIADFIAGFGE